MMLTVVDLMRSGVLARSGSETGPRNVASDIRSRFVLPGKYAAFSHLIITLYVPK